VRAAGWTLENPFRQVGDKGRFQTASKSGGEDGDRTPDLGTDDTLPIVKGKAYNVFLNTLYLRAVLKRIKKALILIAVLSPSSIPIITVRHSHIHLSVPVEARPLDTTAISRTSALYSPAYWIRPLLTIRDLQALLQEYAK
jgi:hypothetical protein